MAPDHIIENQLVIFLLSYTSVAAAVAKLICIHRLGVCKHAPTFEHDVLFESHDAAGLRMCWNVDDDIVKQVITTVAPTKGAVVQGTEIKATTIHNALTISQFAGSNS